MDMQRVTKKHWPNFLRARDGNVSMMFALASPFLLLGIAVSVDFNNASVARTKLNADADAAGLAALTPSMMQQSDATAQAAAIAMFNARAAAMTSLVPGQTTVTVTITHPNGPTSRQVVVDYNAQNATIFSAVLKQTSTGIHGASTSQANLPPNIDFYLLLDNSPSMSLPATAAGITSMQNLTPTQDGGNSCAFACHQASTNNSDTQGNLCLSSNGVYSSPTTSSNQYCAANDGHGHTLTQIDNYAMARHNNITLRLDELTSGVATLMQTATNNATSGLWSTPPSYRFAAYSMDSLWQIGTTNTQLMALTGNYQSAWTSAASSFGVMEMFANNVTCGDSACDVGGSQGDIATNYDNAMSSINTTMPTPGNGTNVAGDTPQEVMFFVTDGVEDEQNINRLIQPINGGATTNYCTLIKNSGIKIAILYTQYLAVPANAFYESNVAPFQANIGADLQACASPNLYYAAAIGDNLGADLAQLFTLATQYASMSH
jgi:Flp pilus assembly protein TadG